MQKKAKLKIINKDIQDDTEELNVLMSKEKASKIMQFVVNLNYNDLEWKGWENTLRHRQDSLFIF